MKTNAEERADGTKLAASARTIRAKLEGNRDARIRIAAEILERSQKERGATALPDAEFRAFSRAIDDIAKYDRVADTLAEVQSRSAARVAVISEPRTYGPSNPQHSYFLDFADYVNGAGTMNGANARLERHAIEVGAEMRRGTSAEGRRARVAFREHRRGDGDPQRQARDCFEDERRAMSSAMSSGGPFVTPQYVIDEWASYRSGYRAFADQCRRLPLPDYGLAVSVPAMNGATQVGLQVENSGVTETDPGAAYLTSVVEPLVGQVTVSQQLNDRGGKSGMAFDMVITTQMREQLDAQVDAFALAQALANAGSVTGAGTFTFAGLYGDLGKARAATQDTAGTRLKASHTFMTADLWAFVSSQVDTTGRPIVTPTFAAQPWADLAAAGDPKGEGWTGHVLPSGLALFEDLNIPASGSNTQIVVSRPQTICLWEGDPIPYSYQETYSTTLSVVVGMRAYVAVIPRYPKATQAISGNAYPTSAI